MASRDTLVEHTEYTFFNW